MDKERFNRLGSNRVNNTNTGGENTNNSNGAEHFMRLEDVISLLFPGINISSGTGEQEGLGGRIIVQIVNRDASPANDDVPERRPRGLSEEQIKSLPKSKFDYSMNGGMGNCCGVCGMQCVERESVRTLPCNCMFHNKCIKDWLKSNVECPKCKKKVFEDE